MSSDRLKRAEDEYLEAIHDEKIAYKELCQAMGELTTAHAVYQDARVKAVRKMRGHYDAMQGLKS